MRNLILAALTVMALVVGGVGAARSDQAAQPLPRDNASGWVNG